MISTSSFSPSSFISCSDVVVKTILWPGDLARILAATSELAISAMRVSSTIMSKPLPATSNADSRHFAPLDLTTVCSPRESRHSR